MSGQVPDLHSRLVRLFELALRRLVIGVGVEALFGAGVALAVACALSIAAQVRELIH